MANKKEPVDYRKLVLGELDVMHKARVVAGSLESVLIGDKAKAEYESMAKKIALEYKQTGTDNPRVTEDEYKLLSDEQKKKLHEMVFNERQLGALETSLREFKDHSEDIFKVGGKYDPKLGSIGNAKDVRDNMPDKYRDFADLHGQYVTYQNMLKDIKDGKKPRVEDKEQIAQLASGAAAKAEYDNMKKKGYSDKRAELAAQIAGLVGGVNPKNPNVESGAKYIMKEIEKRMKLKEGETIEGKAGEYVSSALMSMVKSGDPKREQMALELYHIAQKGYQIGNQSFDEVFKKEDKKKK
ncbi:MAG: hypothetical protein WCK29_04730 [archaeon]